MKKLSSYISVYMTVNPQEKIRIALIALTLVLFVIGAGAPDAGSGIIN